MTLLVFLEAEWRWARIAATGVSHGTGVPARDTDETVTAVVPGDAVVIHWVDLPALAPAQALAAARLLAADVSGSAGEADHVAIGAANADGQRPLALVDRARMASWLARLAGIGIEPDRMIPAPLLLPLPDSGVAVMADGEQMLVRGPHLAMAGEAPLVDLLIGDAERHMVSAAQYDASLEARAAAAIDLRQGEFALQRRWRPQPGQWRRLLLLAAAIPMLWLATEATRWWRESLAADRAEAQLVDTARRLLPRDTLVDAGSAQAKVALRLARLGGGDTGFAALAAPVLAAIEARPELRVVSLTHAGTSGLSMVVEAPTPADQAALAAIPGARVGPPRDEGGKLLVTVWLLR
jgi:general secretion pathway protein L